MHKNNLFFFIVTKAKNGKDFVRYCKSKHLGQQIKLNLTDKTTAAQPIPDPQLEQVLDDPDHN